MAVIDSTIAHVDVLFLFDFCSFIICFSFVYFLNHSAIIYNYAHFGKYCIELHYFTVQNYKKKSKYTNISSFFLIICTNAKFFVTLHEN